MKLSELKQIVEKHDGFTLRVGQFGVYIDYGNNLYMYTDKNVLSFADGRRTVALYGAKQILRALLDYIETAPEEREDEKKYRIILNSNDLFKLFKTSPDSVSLIICPAYTELKSITFTQQEIDNLPQEIKGAIDCGFLKKVEVQ